MLRSDVALHANARAARQVNAGAVEHANSNPARAGTCVCRVSAQRHGASVARAGGLAGAGVAPAGPVARCRV